MWLLRGVSDDVDDQNATSNYSLKIVHYFYLHF